MRLSMRATLGLTIGLMGLLGLVLALFTGEVYRDLALDNQRASLATLLDLKARDLLADLEQKSRDLSMALETEPAFRRMLRARQGHGMAQELDRQFHQYFVTNDVLKLESLVVYGADLEPLAQSSEGDSRLSPGMVCPNLLKRARVRTGPQRLRVVSELCVLDSRPYYTVLVPLGGLHLEGYLEVISDPAPGLVPIEDKLGMPLKIETADHYEVYRSSNWPPADRMSKVLVAEHLLRSPAGVPVVKLCVANDMAGLVNRLAHTRYAVMAAAMFTTALGMFVALVILRRTTLHPLQALTRQLRLVPRGRAHLGTQISVGGPTEVRELAQNFNQMTTELKRLYDTLEHIAFTDPLTGLPNRMRFYECLALYAREKMRYPFALFLIDLDSFKGVNDGLGHHVGDQLLQEVGARMEAVLRSSDIVTRLNVLGLLDGEMIARLGGDEFAVLLPGVDNDRDASAVANKLLAAMESPFIIDGHRFNIGMSIGVALFPSHGDDETVLMRRADAAMYHAKNNRQGYAFFAPDQEQPRLM